MNLIHTVGEALKYVLLWIGMTGEAINKLFGFPISEISIIGVAIAFIYKLLKNNTSSF